MYNKNKAACFLSENGWSLSYGYNIFMYEVVQETYTFLKENVSNGFLFFYAGANKFILSTNTLNQNNYLKIEHESNIPVYKRLKCKPYHFYYQNFCTHGKYLF